VDGRIALLAVDRTLVVLQDHQAVQAVRALLESVWDNAMDAHSVRWVDLAWSEGGIHRRVLRLLSAGIRRKAKRVGVDYSFLFMRADGHQLREITRLIEAGAIRPVIDRVFPFESTNEALAYVETGRAKGKVVVKVK